MREDYNQLNTLPRANHRFLLLKNIRYREAIFVMSWLGYNL